MKLGMVGLPNVGKSTLFNALTNARADSANYPFCTIEPNIGMVVVPDDRIDNLSKLYCTEKTIPAVLEFVDIAGLVRGASKGEGLGNKFLSNIREVDAIIHVVRCFDNDDIIHVDGSISSLRDIQTINLELIFSDIEIVSRRIEKTKKILKSDKKYQLELEFFLRLQKHLENGLPARSFLFTKEQKEIVKTISLLSNKPTIYAANLSESDFTNGINNNKNYIDLLKLSKEELAATVLPICATIEQEISEMNNDDKKLFLDELNLSKPGLDRIIVESYKLLGLISYITAGKQEVRAWTIIQGTKAPEAAGKIHTDFQKGFIKAEVISYSKFIECGNMNIAKEKGFVRLEGKDYVVQDGDIILFRFNV